MGSQLEIYNTALRLIGEQKLSALTDAVEARYTLDDIWTTAVNYCLEQGYWHFSIRSVALDSESNFSPSFGYQFAFDLPTDWLRLYSIATDDNERVILTEYALENKIIYANSTPIYIRFVSNDTGYGGDPSRWSATFQRYVEAHLAAEICGRINHAKDRQEELRKLEMSRLRDASNRNAMDLPARFAPLGSWARSRAVGWRPSSLRGTGRGL